MTDTLDLRPLIRTVPDFPKPGVQFRDVTTLFKDPRGFRAVVERLAWLGLELDATVFGMGTRSKRFALHAVDGVVRQLFVEAPGEFRVSSAEHVLAQLR